MLNFRDFITEEGQHELKEAFGQKPAVREYGDEHLSRYANHIVNDHEREYQGKPVPEHNRMSVSFEHGPKYTRVVTSQVHSRSAHSFIDPKGNIYKAASWKTPAKNFPRGHITDPVHSRVSWTGAQ